MEVGSIGQSDEDEGGEVPEGRGQQENMWHDRQPLQYLMTWTSPDFLLWVTPAPTLFGGPWLGAAATLEENCSPILYLELYLFEINHHNNRWYLISIFNCHTYIEMGTWSNTYFRFYSPLKPTIALIKNIRETMLGLYCTQLTSLSLSILLSLEV